MYVVRLTGVGEVHQIPQMKLYEIQTPKSKSPVKVPQEPIIPSRSHYSSACQNLGNPRSSSRGQLKFPNSTLVHMLCSLPHILSGFVYGLCCNYFPENSLTGLQPAPKFPVAGQSLCDFCPDWHDSHDNSPIAEENTITDEHRKYSAVLSC
jgi:hypothetical protein